MSTHNLCFEQKCEKYQKFLSENFHFLVVKFSVCLIRHVFVMVFIDRCTQQRLKSACTSTQSDQSFLFAYKSLGSCSSI